ncbi:MAG: NAD(P)/FAD-dependent oxidoreductase, partial [Candidatus Hodarchaeales archaeon]
MKFPEEKISRIIESLEIHHIDGEAYSKRGKGAVVWRDTFDRELTQRAIENGATLIEHESVIGIREMRGKYEIRTSKDRYKTKFIVSADGVTSPSLKHLGWPRITKN